MKGVRSRLVVLNVLGIGLILAAMGIALRFEIQANLLGEIDSALFHDADNVRVSHGKSTDWTGGLLVHGKRDLEFPPSSHSETKFVRMVGDLADTVTLNTEIQAPRLLPATGLAAPPMPAGLGDNSPAPPEAYAFDSRGYEQACGGKSVFHDLTFQGHSSRVYSLPVRLNGRIMAVVQAIRDLTPFRAEMHRLDLALATLLPLALLVAGAAGTALVGGAMRPLRRLTEAARNLQPDRPLPVVGQDEFTELAIAFNEAFERQQRTLHQLERFTGDAGHELRTPLAAIKGSVSMLLGRGRLGPETRRSLEIVDRSADRMTKLINDLLLLARQDGNDLRLAREAIDLASVVDQALETCPPPAGIVLDKDIPADLLVVADASSLERAVANLLANAYAHARTRVRVTAVHDGDATELRIDDDGDGIAPEHLSRLGERFYRPEEARSRDHGGSGLGLSIVKGIMDAHGGSLHIESSVGIGTAAVLTFQGLLPKV